MRLVYRAAPPHYWGIFGKEDQLLEKGVADSLADLPKPKQIVQIVAVIPGDRAMLYQIDNPARNRRTLQQAIPNQLEPDLADDIAALHFAVLDWQRGQSATVAVIDREYLRDVLTQLEDAGQSPDALMPEYFMLPIDTDEAITIGYTTEGSVLLRDGCYGGLAMDQGMLDLWVETLDAGMEIRLFGQGLEQILPSRDGISAVSVELSNNPLVWLEGRHAVLPNLLQGEFIGRHDKSRLSLRTAWVMLAAGVLLWLGMDITEYVHLSRQNATLDQQLEQTFRQAFPDVKRVINIPQQARTEIARLQNQTSGQESYFVILDAIAKALNGSGATIQSIDYRQGEAALYAQVPDYALADQLKRRFDSDRRIKAQLVPSGSSAGVVSVRYNISMAES